MYDHPTLKVDRTILGLLDLALDFCVHNLDNLLYFYISLVTTNFCGDLTGHNVQKPTLNVVAFANVAHGKITLVKYNWQHGHFVFKFTMGGFG